MYHDKEFIERNSLTVIAAFREELEKQADFLLLAGFEYLG